MTLKQFSDGETVPTAWFNEVRDRVQEGTEDLKTKDLVADTGTFKSKPWYDVTHEDWGADNTATVDSSTALQAAIDAANAAGGGVVFFPRGTYRIDTSLVPKSEVVMIGEGPGASILNGNNVRVIDGTAAVEIDGFVMRDMGFSGGTATACEFRQLARPRFQNCRFADSSVGLIVREATKGSFTDLRAAACTTRGFQFGDTALGVLFNANTVFNLEAVSCGEGAFFDGCTGLIFAGGDISSCTKTGLRIREIGGLTVTGIYLENNNTLESATEYEINVTTASVGATNSGLVMSGIHVVPRATPTPAVIFQGALSDLAISGLDITTGASPRLVFNGCRGYVISPSLDATRIDDQTNHMRILYGDAQDAEWGDETAHKSFRLAHYTTAQRNALTPTNGDLLYNSDTTKIEAYQNGAWINLEDGSAV